MNSADAIELDLGLPNHGTPGWDVTVTAPLDLDRDCPVPPHPPLPAGVIGCWMREQVEAGGKLVAEDHAEASALAARAFAAWLALPGAQLTVRPATAPLG